MQEGDFDFKEISEEPETLDFSKKVLCPHCKKPIPHDATMCLFCGEEVYKVSPSSWVKWVAIALVIIFGLIIITR
jgi:hypothetical protein